MGWLAAGLILPCLAADGLVRCLIPSQWLPFRLTRCSLAICLGLGLSSMAYFLGLLLQRVGPSYRYVELAVFAALAFGGWYWGRSGAPANPGATLPAVTQPMSDSRFMRLFFATAVTVVALVILRCWNDPEGAWDAWANWNHRARFLCMAPSQWREALRPSFFGMPDYPLLLPTVNARLWHYLGDDPEWLPQVTGTLFLVATTGLFVGGLGMIRGRDQGWLGGAVLLGFIPFVDVAVFQYADTPIASYYLAAVMLAALYDSSSAAPRGLLALSGALAGLAAWTKNEGLLFVLVCGVSRCLVAWRRPRPRLVLHAATWLAGAAVPLLWVLYFKSVAPETALVARQGWDITSAKLLDPQRYLLVFDFLLQHVLSNALSLLVAVPICVLLLGRARPASAATLGSGSVFGLMAAGYVLTYVTTPYDLRWHLSTSMERLLVQLWPLGLLTLFLCLRPPGEMRSQGDIKHGREGALKEA